MSHIVKGKVDVAYKDKALLLKSLSGLGIVSENEKLYRVGVGYTSEKYPLVLICEKDSTRRVGYKERNGIWEQFQEEYGTYGAWTKRVTSAVQDRYLAYHYEQRLIDEGFNVTIKQQADGSLELEAKEQVW